MTDLKQQATKAFIWDFSGKLAMHGMSFITTIFLARLLEPSDFGLIAMVMVIIGIAGIFSDVGLGSALIQRKRILPIHYSSVFYFNITIGSLLTLLTYLSAPLIADFYDNQALIALTQVISFSFVLGAFSSVQSTKLRKELNYSLLTKVAFTASLISGVLGVSLAFYGAGVWSLVIQALSQRIIYNIIIWYASHWIPSKEFSLKALMQLWAFGFRMFLSAFLDTIFTRIDILIIGKLFTPVALGYFNLAKQLDQMVIHYSSGSLMSILFPVLSKVKNNIVRFQSITMKSLGIIIFIVFFLLGGLYLVSNELIIILFGERWLQTVGYFKILLLSGFGYPISALLVNVLSSRGNSKAFLRLEIYKKIIFGVNLTIGFIWGIEGYLYGLFIATTLAVLLNIYFVSHELDLPKMHFIKPIVIQMLITVVVTFFIVFINNNLELGHFWVFLIKGTEFTILYVLSNKFLNTNAYNCFISEAKPIYNKVLKKIRR
jgi:O-antigen/teichoic acid export membrane protein